MSFIEWQNYEYEKECALEQSHRGEIDNIYAPLNAINSKASPGLIRALNPHLKQKPSRQQSSKRRRASSGRADKATVSQTKRLKSSLKATSNSVQKQKPSQQQQSSQRRRASNKSANEVTKLAKRLKSNLEYLSIIVDLGSWEHLSDNDFYTRRFRL